MNDNSRVLVARTAVENVPYENERIFEYTIPDSLKDDVCVGMRAAVPFGNGKKSRTAFIVELYGADSVPEGYKQINSLIDKYPVVSEELINCARFISERCFCTLYESIKAMLPAGINYKISMRYSLIDYCPEGYISQTERDILTVLKNNEEPLTKEYIGEAFDKSIDPEISHLESIKAIARIDDVSRRIKDASIKSIRLKDIELSDIHLTSKQSQVYDLLTMQESASVKEICYFLGITPSVTDGLVKKGIAEYFEEETFRIPQIECAGDKPAEELKLNHEQMKAYDNLSKLLCDGKPHASLLYGVTGSGKTSVFTCLIDKALSENKGTIVMVPEISLTPQMISKFKKRYGDEIAVFHSGLSMGERLDEWKRVKLKKAHIVIGTRSAVFAPLENLGLIIIDEEQEHTYKSERSPRYHARDVAKFRCVQNNALLVLSSATPSVETMYYAKKGIYSLNELPKRYGNAVLPDVITADMNEEAANGNRTPFSSVLLQTIEDNLNAGRQSIILLNRRGYNTYVSCKKCGKIVDCPNCSVSMTYHHANNRMMCHYCGYSMPFTGVCPNCSAENSLRLSGTGTQKAEIDLSDIFPSARILRLDADSTLKKRLSRKATVCLRKGRIRYTFRYSNGGKRA